MTRPTERTTTETAIARETEALRARVAELEAENHQLATRQKASRCCRCRCGVRHRSTVLGLCLDCAEAELTRLRAEKGGAS